MKMIVAGIATALLAGAAMAQTVTPVEPPVPAPTDSMAAAPTTEVATLVEKDGKWWNGDREATPQEIEAHKKAKKRGQPK